MKLTSLLWLQISLLSLGLFACKGGSPKSGGEQVAPTEAGTAGDSDISNDGTPDDQAAVEDDLERAEAVKTFIDYCEDDADDPALQIIIQALKDIANEQKLCGVVQGKISRVSELNLVGKGISDVRPLRGFKTIPLLDLGANQVSDIEPLSTMTGLNELFLINNPVSDLSPIAGLSRLKVLNLGGTDITDITSIAGIKSLTALGLSSTAVSDISSLSALTSLKVLDVSRTNVASIASLSGLNALENLNLSATQVSDLSSLTGLATSLKTLDLSQSAVTDVSALSSLTALENLSIAGTQVTDISALQNLNLVQFLADVEIIQTCVPDGAAASAAVEQVCDEFRANQ